VTQSSVYDLAAIARPSVQSDDAAVDRVLHASSRDHPYIVLRDCGHSVPRLCSNGRPTSN